MWTFWVHLAVANRALCFGTRFIQRDTIFVEEPMLLLRYLSE